MTKVMIELVNKDIKLVTIIIFLYLRRQRNKTVTKSHRNYIKKTSIELNTYEKYNSEKKNS